jgi:hypothetical protein
MGYGNSVTHFLFLNNHFPTLFPTTTIKIRVKTLKPCQIKKPGLQEVELGLFGRPYSFGGIFILKFPPGGRLSSHSTRFQPLSPLPVSFGCPFELKIIDLR